MTFAEKKRQLDDKFAKQDQLRKQLNLSLQLQQLCPDAFKHGKCRCHITGDKYKPNTLNYIVVDGIEQEQEHELQFVQKVCEAGVDNHR